MMLKIIWMMPVELNQNNCNSLKAFKPVFTNGLCDRFSNASLDNNLFEILAL